jgi:hypothetical protein
LYIRWVKLNPLTVTAVKYTFFLLFCIFSFTVFSQDTVYLKVHFLYGSKPFKKYKSTESRWFGGMLGGHVGIEGDSGKIVNFLPQGKFHWFARKSDRHSIYALHSENAFYSILGGNGDSVKKAVVYVPVTENQKERFDSITRVYLKQVPYDYAFWGMRCGAATYEILGQLGILPGYGIGKTYRRIFYPRRLRKRLFKKAIENNWKIITQEGTIKRKWEKD